MPHWAMCSKGLKRLAAGLVIFCLQAVVCAQPATSAEATAGPLRISVADFRPAVTPQGDGYMDQTFKVLFGRAGIDYELVLLPVLRGKFDASVGLLDGAVAPVRNLGPDFSGLVALSTPILPISMVGLYTRNDISITSIEDFLDYRLAYIKGWQRTEELFSGHERVEKVRSIAQLMTMLDNGRVDVVFSPLRVGSYVAGEMGLPELKVSEYRVMQNVYLHLNKRHASLIPELEKQLALMKADGTLDAIMAPFEFGK